MILRGEVRLSVDVLLFTSCGRREPEPLRVVELNAGSVSRHECGVVWRAQESIINQAESTVES